MADEYEVGLFDCCAEPGGCKRCVYVAFCGACGCPAGDMADRAGKNYWMWCLISILPIGACVAHCCVLPQDVRKTMGVKEPSCCGHCMTQCCCFHCAICRNLNEFDRRKDKNMIANPATSAQAK